MARLARLLLGLLAGLVALTALATYAGLLPVPVGPYDDRQLRVTDCSGTTKATVTARVADSTAEQYVGLSRTERLADDEGMLFPGSADGDRRIVMRGMNFGLDVAFVGSDGQIRSLVTLDAPEGPIERHLTYPGVTRRGQYVLEVPAGWTDRTGVGVGDCVRNLP